MSDGLTRADAEQMDATDPLGPFRERFAIPDADLIYMDGNSLGRPTIASLDAIQRVAAGDWAQGLIRSWKHWIDLPRAGGDLVAGLVGAADGEVVMGDQTSVNLYKLAEAAIAARPEGKAIVTDEANFPSDLYVLGGIAERHGLELRVVPSDPNGTSVNDIAAAAGGAALVSMSHVAYKTGAMADMEAITAAAHGAGALTLWDLSHSVGAVEVDLARANADLAVGCTYKYLNGGPGSPAFLYVRSDLQDRLDQPIRGWFSHPDMFAFAAEYEAAPDIGRFTVGTPPILSMAAAVEGIRVTAEAGMGPIRTKSVALTELLVSLFDAWLAPLGFTLGSPRDIGRRGGHVSLRHPRAQRIRDALVEEHGVIPDFRTPDTIRFGPAPLYTSFCDVWDAMDRTRLVGSAL